MDKADDNKSFASKNNFTYPLICDVDGVFVKAFGVKELKKGICARETIIINKDGNIVHIDRKANADPAKQNPGLLDVLRKQK